MRLNKVCTVLFLGLFFCFRAYADDIKIGVAGPMTGGLAAFGEQIDHGAEIATEEINQNGGLLGKRLSLVVEDDACDPKQARTVANKMVALNAAVVFGHWCAASSMAASGVYGEEGIVQIDVGALLTHLTLQGFSTIFRVSATSQTFARALGLYTKQHNPGATLVIITDQAAVTKELTQGTEAYFATTGNKILAVEDIHSGEKDFSSLIDKVKELHPAVVVCSCYTVEGGLIARQMAEKKLDVFFYSWDAINSPDFYNIVAGLDLRKIVGIDYARPDNSASYQKLVAALNKKHWPTETTTFMTYAAFQLYADAVRNAESFNPQKVAKALRAGTFSTLFGNVSFDDHGDRKAATFAAYQWDGARLKKADDIRF